MHWLQHLPEIRQLFLFLQLQVVLPCCFLSMGNNIFGPGFLLNILDSGLFLVFFLSMSNSFPNLVFMALKVSSWRWVCTILFFLFRVFVLNFSISQVRLLFSDRRAYFILGRWKTTYLQSCFVVRFLASLKSSSFDYIWESRLLIAVRKYVFDNISWVVWVFCM